MSRLLHAAAATALVSAAVLLPSPARGGDDKIRARIVRLARIVKTDSSFKLRALAARRLGSIAAQGGLRDPVALRALVECLDDENDVVRGVCAQALGEHKDPSTLPDLERVARRDASEVVKKQARISADMIRPLTRSSRLVATKNSRRLTVALGRIELARDSGLEPPLTEELLRVIRTAIEDRIEPHRPAVMPREQPDLRIDVIVNRVSSEATPQGRDIRFEARVVIIELPGANLRHASQAIASTRGARRRGKKMLELEERMALQAVNRAVDEALGSLLGTSG